MLQITIYYIIYVNSLLHLSTTLSAPTRSSSGPSNSTKLLQSPLYRIPKYMLQNCRVAKLLRRKALLPERMAGDTVLLASEKKARARSQELPHCTGISLPFEKVGLDIFHKPNSPPSQLNSAIDDLGKVLGASELLARKHPSWQMDYLSPSCQTPCHLGAASTLSCHTGHLPLYLSAYLLSLPDSSSAHTLC